ncbi:MAG: hypothetical protein D6814_12585 [Calditrichaeota bacterium]|nr:MAG: hypothetical protein D6814_12585 [Calditrichota bacterium]
MYRGANHWQVIVQAAVPGAWLAKHAVNANAPLTWRLQLFNAHRRLVKSTSREWPVKSATNASRARELLQFSQAIEVAPGEYSLTVKLESGQQDLWSASETQVSLPQNAKATLVVSDLIPVDFPLVSAPPFEAVLWIPDIPVMRGFFLYYEIYSSVPDTFVTLSARVVDDSGKVRLTDQFRLYVGENLRQDYLRVDADMLPPGRYSVILEAGLNGAETKRTINFIRGQVSQVTILNETLSAVWKFHPRQEKTWLY